MGFTLQTSNRTGFSVSDIGNVTTRNTTMANNWHGVDFVRSQGDVLSGNNVTGNMVGILLADDSIFNIVSENNVTSSISRGIEILSSGNVYPPGNPANTVSRNNLSKIHYGVFLVSSSNVVLYHTNFIENVPQVLSGSSLFVKWIMGILRAGITGATTMALMLTKMESAMRLT